MKKLLFAAVVLFGFTACALADAANTLIRFTAPVTGSYTLAWENDGVRETVIPSVRLEAGIPVIYQIDSAKAKKTGHYIIVRDGEVVAGVDAAIQLGRPLEVGVITSSFEVPAEYLAAVGAKTADTVVSTSGLTAAAVYALGFAPEEAKDAKLQVYLTMENGKPVVTTVPAKGAHGHEIVIEGSGDLKTWHPASMEIDKFFRAVIK